MASLLRSGTRFSEGHWMRLRELQVARSIRSADFSRLGSQVEEVLAAARA